MALGSDLVQAIKYVDNDIDVSADEAQALWALNRAQDLIELIVAKVPDVLGETNDVTTTASQDNTDQPSRLKRVDRLQWINPTTSLPVWPPLEPVRPVGEVRTVGGSYGGWWGDEASSPGRPWKYTWYGSSFYWWPLPNDTYTVRVWGFRAAADITSGGTFAYDDDYILPVASIAARCFKMQVDDDQEDIVKFTADALTPILDQLRRRWKDGPGRASPRYVHTI